MRILLCSPNAVTRSLGAPKVLIELAEALQRFGWTCHLIGPKDVGCPDESHVAIHRHYAAGLRAYLRQHAGAYDVVDYDHNYLPFARAEFPARPLFVARSVLLTQHFEHVRLPPLPGLRAWVSHVLLSRRRRRWWQHTTAVAMRTMAEADLVNVCNDHDAAELFRRGVPRAKVVVLPFGLGDARRAALASVSCTPPPRPKIAFVGTFDPRKGARDFPRIIQEVATGLPGVTFRLLGTAGMLRTAAEVRACFPRRWRPLIEVTPTFAPEDLPALLADCSLGVFPSYVEGFPFGVLEMLAAGLPVIAYNAPGAPMMLPPEYLATPGDIQTLSRKVCELLGDPAKLTVARAWARARSQEFCWDEVARRTSIHYARHWEQKAQRPAPSPARAGAETQLSKDGDRRH